jgi:hypothetical protein
VGYKLLLSEYRRSGRICPAEIVCYQELLHRIELIISSAFTKPSKTLLVFPEEYVSVLTTGR